MTIYFISFRKLDWRRIRLELAVPALNKTHAKEIARREITQLKLGGYRYLGAD